MKRTITIVILLLLCVSLSGYVFQLLRLQKGYQRIAHQQRTEAKVWRNEARQSRARIASLVVSQSQLEEFYQGMVDSLSSAMDIKTKHWQSVMSAGLQSSYAIEVSTRQLAQSNVTLAPDTTSLVSHRWLRARSVVADGKLKLLVDTRDSVALVTHLHRENIFGRRRLTADLISFNPSSTIMGMRHYSKVVKPRRVGLGVFGGYDLINQRFSGGVGVNYLLVPF